MEQFKQTTMPSSNPLKQYFRTFKTYIRLPSGTSYYSPNEVSFTDQGEIGIMPMTGRDELILKNPDALLNGEAIIEVIKSCVPSVKNPKNLLGNDINALITAVRHATYDDSIETIVNCPKCGHENNFKLNLQYAIDNIEFLDPEYVVNLESGLSVFVKPHGFNELVKGLHAQFEHSKMAKTIESESVDEEAKLKALSKIFKEVSILTYELITASVVRIVDESNNINVTDKKHISEFLQNIDRASIDLIDEQIKAINNIGIKKTFIAKCQKCNHEWENEIDFNPVNFS